MPTATAPESTVAANRDEDVERQQLVPEGNQAPPGPPTTRGNGGSLTKVTVNLLPRTMAALEEVSESTGDNKTETINRAVQLYAWVQRMIDAGESLRVVSPDGQTREIHMF
ncbi:hypothetical protein [Micromonospora sp. NPDC049645]|uniref:hypothetical protein n=1 Tax=Micromonospora sp. NPDC049645 TaxID=3155508 RepID=UPI00341754B4